MNTEQTGENIFMYSSAPINTSLLKQQVQGSTYFAFSIWCVKSNVCQREDIMADSLSSRMLYFSMNSIGSFRVSKKKNGIFTFYAYVSCILVLWPLQVHCLAVKQRLVVIRGVTRIWNKYLKISIKILTLMTSHCHPG